MEWVSGLPIPVAFAVLFVIVMIRANATYWIGRGLRAGAARSRWGVRLDSARMPRARRLVTRWGPIAVTLSFMTIGLQTAINAYAGAMRMPMRRYGPAVVAGSILWATIYSSLGTMIVVALRAVIG